MNSAAGELMFFNDPYNPKPKNVLSAGEWLVMLVFVCMLVCVGFLLVKQFVLEPFINGQIQDTGKPDIAK